MKGPDPHRIRPASAIILRPQGAPRSVYLVERRPDLAFFGGYFAFPGGACDPGDEKIPAIDLPAGSDERRFIGAAARELFEETGVLAAGSARRGEATGAARASGDGFEGDEARRFRTQLLATPPADAPRSFHAMLDGARLSIDGWGKSASMALGFRLRSPVIRGRCRCCGAGSSRTASPAFASAC